MLCLRSILTAGVLKKLSTGHSGGLHSDLRTISMKGLIERNLPGYAIGGLSGGEAKPDFCRMVEICTHPETGLPKSKPRYLMGVGYPLDIVVCVAFGVDMFDCVYPTRTARFGTAIVPQGLLRLKRNEFALSKEPIDADCTCSTCCNYSRGYLHSVIGKETTACHLVTVHNLHYMMGLNRAMRAAIEADAYESFVKDFLRKMFPDESSPVPQWVRDALLLVDIDISDMFGSDSQTANVQV